MKYPNLAIDHKPVESSTISTVGYDEANKEMHVTFHNTGTYVYSNVPPEAHRALMESDSPGTHHHHNIRGLHPHRKL